MLLLSVSLERMKFGHSLLKRRGQNYVEVTKLLKWDDVENFSKILMALLRRFIGLRILLQKLGKINF